MKLNTDAIIPDQQTLLEVISALADASNHGNGCKPIGYYVNHDLTEQRLVLAYGDKFERCSQKEMLELMIYFCQLAIHPAYC